MTKTCPHCGFTNDSGYFCQFCGNRLPFGRLVLSESGWRKLGLTILIPLLVWLAMRALFS